MNENASEVILIIDDEVSIRESFRDYLEDEDFAVLTAENGRVGLEIFEEKKPDLVLVDLRMPDIGGIEVLEKIRESSPETPSIVVSGTGVIADAVEALHCGAWDYLLKPISDMSVILHSVKNALEKAHLRRENTAYRKHLEELVEKRTKQLTELNDRLKAIVRSTRTIAGCSSVWEVSLRMLEEFAGNMAAKGGSIYLLENDKLVLKHTLDGDHAAESIPLPLPPSRVLGKVLAEKSPILIRDIKEAGGISGSGWHGYENASLLAFPLLDQKGEAVGVVTLHNKAYPPFTEQDKEIGEILASHSCETIKAAKAMDCLEKKIDQIRKTEKEKDALAKQLQQTQKMEAIGTLAGGIAHDFNNILSGIVGYTELVLFNASRENEKDRERLNRVLAAAERARDLVRQILQFSRDQRHAIAPLSLKPLVKEVARLVGSIFPATIEIQRDFSIEKDCVLADATQIHQVIMNLCTNAFHAMRLTDGILSLRLENVTLSEEKRFMAMAIAPGDYAKISISDTGSGIASEIRNRVFDPYFTTKGAEEGTGLGLSVSYGIVRKHKGLIEIEDTSEKGTTFAVYLPVADKRQIQQSVIETVEAKGRNQKILVVDDEEFSRETVCEHLESMGYRVSGFGNGPEALKELQANPGKYDLVITDLTMPGITGTKLIAEFRKVNENTPVILCTGFSETVTEESAERYGISKFLMKPVSRKELAGAVGELCGA